VIQQIDNLKLPPSINGAAELFNRDTQRRTVSGRLITKLDPAQKWRVTVSFDDAALDTAYQAQFYAKCLDMRRNSRAITFISPYDGQVVTIAARCVSRNMPSAFNLYKQKPEHYTGAGAVFEEV
jgi:hypothetical protein